MMKSYNRLLNLLIFILMFSITKADEFKMSAYQISITQEPMDSDIYVLRGSIGSNFHQISASDTLVFESGFWKIVANHFSRPPSVVIILSDTFKTELLKDKTPVIARAIAKDVNGILTTDLYLQLGGEEDPVVLQMTAINDSIFEVLIPDSLFTIYNFRANALSKDSMYYSGESDYNSPSIYFGKKELSMSNEYSNYPDGVINESWRMISWPSDLGENEVDMSDNHIFYDWDPGISKWFVPEKFIPGKAYWFKHRYSSNVVLENQEVGGVAIPLEDYVIHLNKGWNMIGNPFSFPVEVAYNPEQLSGLYLYGNDMKDGWEGPVQKIEPWAGYAIHNYSIDDSIIIKPFSDSNSLNRKTYSGWVLKINIEGKNMFDRTARLGRAADALEIKDGYDIPLLPKVENFIMLGLDPGGDLKFDYSSDIRSLEEKNGIWDMRLLSNGSRDYPVDIVGTLSDIDNEKLFISVVDIQQRIIFDDFLQTGVSIREKLDTAYDLKLVAGDEYFVSEMSNKILEDIPAQYLLSQNYPNPFNPITHIDFALPRRSRVNIRVFSLLGKEVITLANEELGYGNHSLIWSGLDQFGKPVATGVYLLKFQTKEIIKTRKMILLK